MSRAQTGIFLAAIVMLVAIAAALWFLGSHPARIAKTKEAIALYQPSSEAAPPANSPPTREHRVLYSPLAGTWYLADKQKLGSEIDGFLQKVPDQPLTDLCALILPHAGYRWSGPTAAYGIKQIVGGKYSRVVTIGPTHRLPMENLASVPDVTHYATPLGETPLDVELIAALKRHALFQTIPQAHQGEHSVQIELPLLQRALGDFQFVPIVVGQLDLPTTRAMAKILLNLIDPKTLLVVSSDFTHYGANFGYLPFHDDIAANLKKLDMGTWQQIENKSLDGFVGYVRETGTTVCGRHGIGVLLAMLPDDAKAHLLRYERSGEMTEDFSNSVSYLSIAFTGQWPARPTPPAETSPATLGAKDKQKLLQLARRTIEHALAHHELPTPEQVGLEITAGMQAVMGAFVTLHKHGQLRGCIGEIVPMRPLYKAVMAQAVNAAVNDRRFPPVQASELDELDLEISALTPSHPVPGPQAIEIGKHGIVLEKNGHHAVFLPQVAPEQGWGLEETLDHLSLKAGLSQDAWKEGASFTVFEAIVFGEDHE